MELGKFSQIHQNSIWNYKKFSVVLYIDRLDRFCLFQRQMAIQFPNKKVKQLFSQILGDGYDLVFDLSQADIANRPLPYSVQAVWECQASGHLSHCKVQNDFEHFMFGGTCECPAVETLAATCIIETEQDRQMLLELHP